MNRRGLLKTKFFGAVSVPLCVFFLSGCDTLDFGYVNKRSHPITIVEHSWDPPRPMTLEPGQILHPGFGHVAKSIDVLGKNRQLLAHYRIRDIPEIGPRHGLEYIVIDSKGAVIDREGSYKYGKSNTINRE